MRWDAVKNMDARRALGEVGGERLLWADQFRAPNVRSGSIPAGQSSRHAAGKQSHADRSNSLRYLFQNASTAFIRRRFSVVT